MLGCIFLFCVFLLLFTASRTFWDNLSSTLEPMFTHFKTVCHWPSPPVSLAYDSLHPGVSPSLTDSNRWHSSSALLKYHKGLTCFKEWNKPLKCYSKCLIHSGKKMPIPVKALSECFRLLWNWVLIRSSLTKLFLKVGSCFLTYWLRDLQCFGTKQVSFHHYVEHVQFDATLPQSEYQSVHHSLSFYSLINYIPLEHGKNWNG